MAPWGYDPHFGGAKIPARIKEKKGERRGSNPRMVESQSTALTAWLRSP